MIEKMKNKMQEVQDRKVEIGISLSVIIQGLILAALIGLGNYIVGGLKDLNKNIIKLTTEISV